MTAVDRRGYDPEEAAFLLGIGVILILAVADFLGLPGGGSVGQMAMLASTPIWFFVMRERHGLVFHPRYHSTIMIILISSALLAVWSLVSTLVSEELLRSGRFVLTQLSCFGMFAFVAGTMSEKRVPVVMLVLTCAAAAVSLLSLVGYLTPTFKELLFQGTDRSFGTFKHPNQFGIFLSTIFPIALALIAVSKGRRRALTFGCIALMFIGLVLSGSKTNLLIVIASMSAMLLAIGFTRAGAMTGLILTPLILAAVALVAFVVYQVMLVFNPRALLILSAFFEGEEVRSLVSRERIYLLSMRAFHDNPLFGIGAGTLVITNPSGETVSHAHNVILDYARALGWPGLVFMGASVFIFVMTALLTILSLMFGRPSVARFRIPALGFSFSVLNYVAANFVSESFGPSTAPFFYLSLAMLFALLGAVFPFPVRRRIAVQSA